MKIDNVLNYLATATPDQIDAIRKAVGEKKQAVLIKREYEMSMQEMKDKHATELKQAQASYRALQDRQVKEIDDKLKWYQVQAASRGLHWEEVMSEPKKQRVHRPRKWKVVTPIAADTRMFIHTKNAIAYRKRMGGYMMNIETGRQFFNNGYTTRLPV